ncbi:MAG: hypothetical protein WCK01_03080 [Candidatus Uhrbacteria bacterium]
MRIRTFDQMMVSISTAAGDVPRLRTLVDRIRHGTDFISPMVVRRENGYETVLPSMDRERISVFRLIDGDPLAEKENDPLATYLSVGPSDNRTTAIGILPHSASPYWHGLRLLVLVQELLAERKLDRMPVPRLLKEGENHVSDWRAVGFRQVSSQNINAHCEHANYQASRLVLDILDTHFGGRIRQKTAELKREGLIVGVHLTSRMRAYIDYQVEMEFDTPASDEEAHARALTTGLCMPALLEPHPIDPYN